jgi:hypothetical protein
MPFLDMREPGFEGGHLTGRVVLEAYPPDNVRVADAVLRRQFVKTDQSSTCSRIRRPKDKSTVWFVRGLERSVPLFLINDVEQRLACGEALAVFD